jgi:hypothetical protein
VSPSTSLGRSFIRVVLEVLVRVGLVVFGRLLHTYMYPRCTNLYRRIKVEKIEK